MWILKVSVRPSLCHGQWQIQNFPEAGTKLKGYGRQPFIWSNVSKKVHENEEKFYRDMRRVSLRCPLNTPMMVLHE